MDCSESKRWVRCPNDFSPAQYGHWKFQAQCLKCGETGKFQRKLPPGITFSDCVEADQSVKYKEERKLQRQEEHETRVQRERAESDRQREEDNRLWWESYNRYLRSARWRSLRQKVLDRDQGICQACLDRPATQVHHLSYRYTGSDPEHTAQDPAFVLRSVCDACHDQLHE